MGTSNIKTLMKASAPSLEEISFQKSSRFFEELTLAFTNLQKLDTFTPKIAEDSGIPAIIEKYTKMKIIFKLPKKKRAADVDAWVLPAALNRNHVLIASTSGRFVNNDLSVSEMKRSGRNFLVGGVDRERGMVTGDFTKYVMTIYIGGYFLGTSLKVTAEHAAAVLLHEVGHALAMFDYVAHFHTTNVILESTFRRMTDSRSMEERVLVVSEAADALDLNIEDVNALAGSKTITELSTVFLQSDHFTPRSWLESGSYDTVSFEALADQFATRQGAGRALAMALDGILTSNIIAKRISLGLVILQTIIRGPNLVGLLLSYLVTTFLKSISNQDDTYDKDKSRFLRIRDQLVTATKEADISDERRQMLNEEIATLSVIVDKYSDKREDWEVLREFLRPKYRNQKKQRELQQAMERLSANSLYVISNSLRTL